jgi:phosphatidylserine decarboxylase
MIRRSMTDEPGHSTSRLDGLRVAFQHILPQRLLTRLVGHAAHVRFRPWKNWQIRWFIARYGVDMSEALEAEPRAYAHFNAFFTRALRAGSRPLDADEDTLLCPADGAISALGDVGAGTLLQAKGRHYSMHALLGGDDARAAPFDNGRFATVYLSPRDYHRVHMPMDGRLREMTYVPGRLFSVNFATTRRVPELFARNERLVCIFDTRFGPMALVLVGALIVAGIETVWSGAVTPPHGRAMRTWRYDDPNTVRLSRGEEMGRFNVGSTVIVLFPHGCMEWRDDLGTGSAVRMGEALGRVVPGARAADKGGSAAES